MSNLQRTRAADGSEVLVLMTSGKSTACRRFPIELSPDPGGMYLRPWCVSAFEGDCFRLAAVKRAERIEWMPAAATHRLFPPSARERAVAAARVSGARVGGGGECVRGAWCGATRVGHEGR